MGASKPGIFRNRAFNYKIKIMIWNSLIRSPIIYGVHAIDLPRHMVENGNIHVQTYKNHDKPELNDRSMVSGEINSTKNYSSRKWNHGSTKRKS